jgi:P-type Ca2+ transporter type 2C
MEKEDRQVKAVRGGRTVLFSVHDLLVGDVLLIEAGDIINVDAILAEGQDIKCDESLESGESKLVKKVSAEIALCNATDGIRPSDPFLIAGTKVLEGVGKSVIVAVGPNSSYGRMLLSIHVY